MIEVQERPLATARRETRKRSLEGNKQRDMKDFDLMKPKTFMEGEHNNINAYFQTKKQT